MTQKDFEESVDAVFVAELDELLTPAEMTRLKKKLITRVRNDWDPFEEEDPLDVGDSDEEDSEELDVEDEDDYSSPTNEDED